MCGILAVVSKNSGNSGFWKPQCDMFHELLMVDTLRGDDSTGVFLVDKDGDLEMLKEASDGPVFQKTKDYDTFMQHLFARGRVAVGHNRKATKGSITDENAHPFAVDNKIVLVHNGTLYGDYKKLAGEGNDVDVDSHAIAHIIHQSGDDVEKAIQQLNGAFALIWFDMEKQTVNFLRNDQRPLWFLETTDSYVWSSEKNFLDWMVSRHNLTPVKLGQLEAGVHCSIKLEASSVSLTNKKIALRPASSAPWTGPVWNGQGYPTREEFNCMSKEEYENFWNTAYPDADSVSAYLPSNQDVEDAKILDREVPKSDLEALKKALENPGLTTYEEEAQKIVKNNQTGNRFRGAAEKRAIDRTNDQEERLVWRYNSGMSFFEFSQTAHFFRDGVRYRAVAVDYHYINGIDKSNGLYLYLFLKDNQKILVRCPIPPEFDELKLVDATTHKKEMSFVLRARAWRAFGDKALVNGKDDGIAIAYGDDCKIVVKETNAQEVGSGTQ